MDLINKRTRAIVDCDLSENYKEKHCLIYELDEKTDNTLKESNKEIKKNKFLKNETKDEKVDEELVKHIVIEAT